MSARRPKRRTESFDSLCRRAGISPGDPTPAVSSRGGSSDWGSSEEAHFISPKESGETMPRLTTTLEVFCLRTGRKFKVRETAIKVERYQRWKHDSEVLYSRDLVACKHCSDTHQLLSTWQAASFAFLGDPVGGRPWTRKDLSFGRWNNRHIFDRKKGSRRWRRSTSRQRKASFEARSDPAPHDRISFGSRLPRGTRCRNDGRCAGGGLLSPAS